jgi:hypothetical protein
MDNRYMKQQARNRQMAQHLARRGMGDAPIDVPAGYVGQGAQGLSSKFDSGILTGFKPGNIGEINNVIWPFAFQFSADDLAPNGSGSFSFSVTQEAGFLMRQISHATFRKNGNDYEYIDPFYFDESANSPNGLVFTIEDAQSSRVYNGRVSEDIAMLGNANYPKIYPSTVFLLPNQTMLINMSNTNQVETYRSFVTVWGYRVRVADSQNILSTVTG